MKTEYIDKTAIGISEEAKDSLKGIETLRYLEQTVELMIMEQEIEAIA